MSKQAVNPATQHSTFNIFSLMKRILNTAPSYTKSLLLLFFLAIQAGLNAQTATLSVQGVLTRSDGTAVDDGNDYVLTFRLWKSETSTNPSDRVHVEVVENITIVGGVYSVVLGLDPAEPLTAPFDQPYWLGVSVGTSSVELLPRPRLTHAPYALGLVGQNNIFPSTGPVIGDGFRAKGGSGTNGHGFSFQSPSGDSDGGMYSDGDNNIRFFANNTERMKLTNSQNELYGTTVNFGSFTSNDLTVNGNQQVNGSSTITAWQQVNGLQTINNNQIVNGFSTVTANQTVDGIVRSGEGIINKTFTNSGMYWSSGNHDIQFNVKGSGRLLLGDNGTNYITGPTRIDVGSGHLFFLNIKPKGTTGNPRNIAIDMVDGRIFEESSSRRYKKNIRPLQENFSLLLKVQPRIYNRYEDPADIDTSKYYELGYIAEEIDSIGLHKLVQYNNEGQIDGVDYTKMILYAVEVLKMQHEAIVQLQTEVAQLKAENIGLTDLNKTLNTNNTVLEQQQEEMNKQLAGILKRIQALEASSTGK